MNVARAYEARCGFVGAASERHAEHNEQRDAAINSLAERYDRDISIVHAALDEFAQVEQVYDAVAKLHAGREAVDRIKGQRMINEAVETLGKLALEAVYEKAKEDIDAQGR